MSVSSKSWRVRACHAAGLMVLAAVLSVLGGCTSKPAAPQKEQPGEIVLDAWDAAYYLDGSRAGNVHTTVHRQPSNPERFRTRIYMDLRVKRYGQVVPMRMEQTTVEETTGKLVRMEIVQYLDQGNQRATGTVDGSAMVIRSQGQAQERRVEIPETTIGPWKQNQILQEQSTRPGTTWKMDTFELSLQVPTILRGRMVGPEQTDILVERDGKLVSEPKQLVRCEIICDPVTIGGQTTPLPSLDQWVANGEVVRSRVDMPGLGPITMYRVPEAAARREDASGGSALPDLGSQTLIFLDRPVPDIHNRSEVTYDFTLPGDANPSTSITLDERQVAGQVKGSQFELLVKRDQGNPAPAAGPATLAPNFFLDSTDKVVMAMAAKATGNSPWEIAKSLERQVHEKMSTTSGIGFATAGQVARELRGDCRQHAMLLATLCRARAIPSRTALGLVYIIDRPTGRPALGFHMWTEVYCDGAWRGLDATLGEGRIGPGHIKVTDTTWADAPSLAPLLPVLRVMGRLKATVHSFR